ncbi:MAG: DUF3313 domain-containing protein [Gammaproteobacteria bacterium]|nr:DUF3313 domain-containing protein [Gammaproteobacteria bacterium]
MKKILASLLVSSALLSGCANNTISSEKYSGFLHDYSILKKTPDDKDSLASVTPGVDWSKYHSVWIDEVQIITPNADAKTDGKLLLAIANKLQDLIKQEVGKEFSVVEQAGEGTVRVQAAITSVFTSYDDLKGYQYIPIAAAVTGAARASGAESKSVRVMAEGKLLDSVDGQLLAQVVDMKAGGKKQDENSAILLADVQPILEMWAARLADRLSGLRDKAKAKAL